MKERVQKNSISATNITIERKCRHLVDNFNILYISHYQLIGTHTNGNNLMIKIFIFTCKLDNKVDSDAYKQTKIIIIRTTL